MNNTVVKGMLFGLAASLIWGAWPVFSTIAADQQFSASDLTALRFAIAGCLLLPVLIIQRVKLKMLLSKGLLLAAGAGVPYVLLATTGLSIAPSSHFAIIAPSSMLVFTALASAYWLRESMSPARIAGVTLILIGIIAVGGNSLNSVSATYLKGDLMFLGCGMLWASYTVLCKYWSINPWTATASVSVLSMLIYLPYYLLNSDLNILAIPLKTLLLQGVFQGVIVAIMALFCYSKAVALLGSGKGSIFSALVPPISLMLGYLLLKQDISQIEYIGLGFVCSGMFLALELIVLPKIALIKHKPSH